MSVSLGLLLTTALLAPPVPASPPADPAVPQQRVEDPGKSPTPTERPHSVGLGGFGGSGAGVSFRFFPWAQVGFDVDVAFSGSGNGRYTNGPSNGTTFRVAPSTVVMFTKTHPLWDIDLRPYAGVGFNYTYTSQVYNRTSTTQLQNSGVGMQAYGGTEITFAGADMIAISAQVAYYRLPVQPVNLLSTSGTDFYLMFHYYMK